MWIFLWESYLGEGLLHMVQVGRLLCSFVLKRLFGFVLVELLVLVLRWRGNLLGCYHLCGNDRLPTAPWRSNMAFICTTHSKSTNSRGRETTEKWCRVGQGGTKRSCRSCEPLVQAQSSCVARVDLLRPHAWWVRSHCLRIESVGIEVCKCGGNFLKALCCFFMEVRSPGTTRLGSMSPWFLRCFPRQLSVSLTLSLATSSLHLCYLDWRARMADHLVATVIIATFCIEHCCLIHKYQSSR